ncbi:MAG: O-methyltransferase [Candidatus Hodarchaeales archaeon]
MKCLTDVFNQTSYKNNKSLVFLQKIVKKIQPNYVLEFGTGNGLSSIYMGLAIEKGKIISVDKYEVNKRETIQENITNCGVANKIELVGGDTREAGSLITDIEPEILFMDASHSSVDLEKEYKTIKNILPKKHLIIIDDSLTGAGKDFIYELSKAEEYKFTITFNQLHFGLTLLGTSLSYLQEIKEGISY